MMAGDHEESIPKLHEQTFSCMPHLATSELHDRLKVEICLFYAMCEVHLWDAPPGTSYAHAHIHIICMTLREKINGDAPN